MARITGYWSFLERPVHYGTIVLIASVEHRFHAPACELWPIRFLPISIEVGDACDLDTVDYGISHTVIRRPPQIKFNVRQAVEADAEQVIALMGQFVQYLRNLGDTTESNFSMDAYLRDGFGSDPAFFGLVADSDEEIVGYLLYHFGYDIDLAARVLHVIDLYVVENYRAHGVGKALMMHAKQECHEVGAKEIVLSVYKRNPSASAFYEHLVAKYIDDEDFLHLEIGDRDEQGNPDTQ